MPFPLLFNAVYLKLVFLKKKQPNTLKARRQMGNCSCLLGEQKLSLMHSVLGILPTSLVRAYVTGLQHLTAGPLCVWDIRPPVSHALLTRDWSKLSCDGNETHVGLQRFSMKKRM